MAVRRRVIGAGGSIAAAWPLARALAIGDRATAAAVLAEQYARMGARPDRVDLEALWARLGIRLEGRRVVIDPAADKAALRHALLFGP